MRARLAAYSTIAVSVGLFITSPSSDSWAQDPTAPPGVFQSVDEAIGWVKGKGSCSSMSILPPGLTLEGGVIPRGTFCEVKIQLPPTLPDGKVISPGWTLTGSLKAGESSAGTRMLSRRLSVVLERSRIIPLSSHDSSAWVKVYKSRIVGFDGNGVAFTSIQNRLTVSNFYNEILVDVRQPQRSVLEDVDAADANEDVPLIMSMFRWAAEAFLKTVAQ